MSVNNRIILVYPSSLNDSQKPDRPPLGLLTVAASLIQKKYEVIFFDERAEAGFDTEFIMELKKGALCVGISSMSGRHINGALRISKIVKEHSAIPVVWGGVQASLEPLSTIKHPLIDYIVRDDGEETFPLLLEQLKTGAASLESIRGIGFKRNGEPVLTEDAEPAVIDNIPVIPYYLAKLEKYHFNPPWAKGQGVLAMETSRGCPFSCCFCTESVRKKKWRALTPRRVVDDLKGYIEKYKIHNFTFIDDNLFGNIKRGEEIIELLIAENLNINWYTNIRTDYVANISDEFLRKLEKSGCRMLTFGAESGSEKILSMVNKKASINDVYAANKKLKSSSIIPHFVTISGFPTETRDDLKKTFELNFNLILKNPKATISWPFLIPTPGTKIADMCLKEKTKSYTLEDWSGIFDLVNHGKPEWVDEEAYKYYLAQKWPRSFLTRANLASNSWVLNWANRVVLRLLQISLFGFKS